MTDAQNSEGGNVGNKGKLESQLNWQVLHLILNQIFVLLSKIFSSAMILINLSKINRENLLSN